VLTGTSYCSNERPITTMSGNRFVPVAPQQPRAVLPEEEYHRNLSEVIQRQYFPDLVDLQAQASVQRKLEAGDVVWAESVRRAAGLLKYHDALVQQAELEEEEGDGRENDGAGIGANLRSKPRPLHLETLTGFHARVTSEDNADFETAQTEEMRRNRIERAKMLMLTSGDHDAPNDSQPTLKPLAAAAAPPQLLPGADTPLILASDAFDAPPSAARPKIKEARVENGFFFVPNTVEPSRDCNEEDSNQKLLMPPPSLPLKSTQLVAATASTATIPNALVEYIPKKQLEKRIEPANTRFPSQSHVTNLMSTSLGPAHYLRHHHLEGEADDESTHYSFRDGSTAAMVAGTGTGTDSDTDIDRDSVDGSSVTSDRLHELRRQAQKRKEREWQTLVPLSPTTAAAGTPRGEEDANQTPATDPLSSSSATSFLLPPTLPREVVAERAHELSQRRSKRAGQASVSSSSASSGANRRGESSRLLLSDSLSVRSALSSRSGTVASGLGGRPDSAWHLSQSRSALGTALLRSAYGSAGGPGLAPALGNGSVRGGESIRVRSRTRSSSSSSGSRRDRNPSSTVVARPRVAK
jgi:Nuclear protein Es2